MGKERNPNLEMLEVTVACLGPLVDDLVFLGGCAAGLLITDTAAPPVRATRDVDVITGAGSLADYYRLSEKLRSRGFVEDTGDEAPICRWKIKNIVLDVMPTNPELLGFGNQWYRPAVEHAQLVTLPSGAKIRMVTGPFFLATKLEAFDGRGKGDYMASHDMEDIISVIDGRPELVAELKSSSNELRCYLAKRFRGLLGIEGFVDSLPAHLPGDAASQARLPMVIERIEAIADSG